MSINSQTLPTSTSADRPETVEKSETRIDSNSQLVRQSLLLAQIESAQHFAGLFKKLR